jgi:hypothetical protein
VTTDCNHRRSKASYRDPSEIGHDASPVRLMGRLILWPQMLSIHEGAIAP